MTEHLDNNEYRQQRLANMEKLRQAGIPVFGRAYSRTANLAAVREAFEENKAVSLAGRLLQIRNMGKTIFADLNDGSAKLQLCIKPEDMSPELFEAFNFLDIGDFIGVEGTLFTTKRGEKTCKVVKWTMLSKALLPLPEKWHGLKDVEQRYRQRYLDLATNPEVRDVFNKRIHAIRAIRQFLFERGFMEVETPMMQPIPGGAAARPFVTHYGALDCSMYMRIAPELYLKRLLVGGFDKVFELNRNFRNEGLSRTHNPEFTMLELYEAYSDLRGMKVLIEGLIRHVAETVFGTLTVGAGERVIDLGAPWREATYRELVLERMGADWYSLPVEEARRRAAEKGVTTDPSWDMLLVTHEVYEKVIEKSLIQPTFVTRLPACLVPLARVCEDDPSVVDVFELVINGQEVAPAYTEMNDPIEQRKRFLEQAGEDQMKLDEDFLMALEHGMPPAGGMGVGIDRLVMILSGCEAIRDVILFPQLRPKA